MRGCDCSCCPGSVLRIVAGRSTATNEWPEKEHLPPNLRKPWPAAVAYAGAALAIAYEPPQGEAEEAVAAVFAEVLRLPRVGRHDNFFASGGDSIRAVQVLVRLEAELGFQPPPTTVFRRPTPASLARELARLREERELESLAFALDELPPEEARKLLAMK